MAYRRKSSSLRARKRTGRFVKRGGPRRRYPTKKRTYRKNRAMPRKRILNITSRKKRDTMQTVSNTNPNTGASQAIANNSAVVNGANQGFFVFAATGRDLTIFNGSIGAIGQEASRTSTTCYMRGLYENIRVQTSSSQPWIWRRICFKYRGFNAFNTASTSDTPLQNSNNPIFENTNGHNRLWLNQNVNGVGNTIAEQYGILFKGQRFTDWSDPITAATDTRRVDVCYDRTRIINSGNANGVIRDYKLWHPMNKNIVYDDDESGDVELTSNYSVKDKRGMGDYYVVDLVSGGAGATSTDLISFNSNASLYWHEK
uniref:Capsid protein n=1 Tax=Turdus pallidus Genomoviridae sp. TaxID=2814956 RepID=A0A8E7G1V0_9VIRU|nr:MAG: capsid protein [Gemycircularvirus]